MLPWLEFPLTRKLGFLVAATLVQPLRMGLYLVDGKKCGKLPGKEICGHERKEKHQEERDAADEKISHDQAIAQPPHHMIAEPAQCQERQQEGECDRQKTSPDVQG